MTYLLPLILLLTGCATFDPVMPERRSMLITVEPRADLPPGIDGRATWTELSCRVELREYPRLLGHEVRHCFEGQWHGRGANGSDW